jgi:molecular chaperone GrpE
MEEKNTVVEEVGEELSEEEVEGNIVEMPEAEMYKDRWMRLAAEFENYKKRTAREFQALIKSASEDVIRDLLPILDGVGRALAHREDGQEETEGYQEGVAMLMEQFPKVLKNRNLKEIETVGQPFDPNIHEALMQMVSDTIQAGHVADVVERGYSLGDKVLRPAKVVVSQGKAEEGNES